MLGVGERESDAPQCVALGRKFPCSLARKDRAIGNSKHCNDCPARHDVLGYDLYKKERAQVSSGRLMPSVLERLIALSVCSIQVANHVADHDGP